MHGKPMTVTLIGPGEFDDLTVQEKLGSAPNLVRNSGFEAADKDGRPVGWGKQRKFRAIGPTYYVWTDWNHAFRANRGPVSVDLLGIIDGGCHYFDVSLGAFAGTGYLGYSRYVFYYRHDAAHHIRPFFFN